MPASKPKIVITGANGFLGSALVAYFNEQGWQVVALVRNAHRYKSRGVVYAEYDMAKPFKASVFADADYLVHTAYVKYDKKQPEALKINLEGSKQLLKVSRQHKLSRNIF